VSIPQIIAVTILMLVVSGVYLPQVLHLLKRQPSSLSQIQSVLRIRDNTNSTEVRSACTALLEALLK
jgi:hypothetical protein